MPEIREVVEALLTVADIRESRARLGEDPEINDAIAEALRDVAYWIVDE